MLMYHVDHTSATGTAEQVRALREKSQFVGELYAEESTHDASKYFSYLTLRLKRGTKEVSMTFLYCVIVEQCSVHICDLVE